MGDVLPFRRRKQAVIEVTKTHSGSGLSVGDTFYLDEDGKLQRIDDAHVAACVKRVESSGVFQLDTEAMAKATEEHRKADALRRVLEHARSLPRQLDD